MKNAAIAVLASFLCHAEPARAESNEPWPNLEDAFKSAAFIRTERTTDRSDWPLTLPRSGCPPISIEDYRSYAVTVRFDATRTVEMDVLIGRLPIGFDAYKTIEAALKEPGTKRFPDGCSVPKSGLSLLQVDRYWIAFPTRCRDTYSYRKALPIMLGALQRFFPERFPAKFIFGPCGEIKPCLVDVSEYIAKKGLHRCPERAPPDGIQNDVFPPGSALNPEGH